jgi:hypothetical protein
LQVAANCGDLFSRVLILVALQAFLFEKQEVVDFASQFEQFLWVLLFGGQLTELPPAFLVFAHGLIVYLSLRVAVCSILDSDIGGTFT